MTFTERLTLDPIAPFDFQKSLAFLGGFKPTKQDHRIERGSLRKAVVIDGQPVVFSISEADVTAGPKLDCLLHSNQALSDQRIAAAADRISFFLSLSDDLTEFYRLSQTDQAFQPVVCKLFGYHQVKFLTPFENACWAILAQRNPMLVAAAMKRALIERFDNQIEVEGQVFSAFPDVAQLRQCGQDELAELLGNRLKADYLHAVITAFDSVDETFLRHGDYATVEAWLRAIHGIGAWSASFVLIRGLGRTEVIPPDRAVMRAAEKLYGRTLSPQQFSQLANSYGRWQGYWGHYMRVFN